MANNTNHSSSISVLDIVMIGLCTAIIVVMAQISIPMPMGVPMTMQTFAITLIGVVLGAKRGGISALVYILLGAIGVPVFANFNGGFQNLIGPTGGFLWSFPIMAFIIGLGAAKWHSSKIYFIAMLILGTVLNYIVGVVMFCIVMEASVGTAISACVIPFIPTAIIKAILASVLGIQIRKALRKAGFTY